MMIDGKFIIGSNTEVTYDYGELKDDISYTVYVADGEGTILKDSSGNNAIKAGGKITCKDGFFQRLAAFFRGLFRILPKVTVKPE